MRDFVEEYSSALIVIVFALVMFSCAFWYIGDLRNGTSFYVSGVVVEKNYTPSSSGSGVGYAPNGNGPVVVFTNTSEKFTVFVEAQGRVEQFSVSKTKYFKMNVGDEVKIKCSQGRVLKIQNCVLQ